MKLLLGAPPNLRITQRVPSIRVSRFFSSELTLRPTVAATRPRSKARTPQGAQRHNRAPNSVLGESYPPPTPPVTAQSGPRSAKPTRARPSPRPERRSAEPAATGLRARFVDEWAAARAACACACVCVRASAAARRPLSRERGGQPSSSRRLTWMGLVEGEGTEKFLMSRRNRSHLNSSTVVTALLRPALTTLSTQLKAGHRPP